MITQSRLKELLDYNPETGNFYWKERRSNNMDAGSQAGSVHITGYIQIKVDRVLYKAHRLAFVFMCGECAAPEVDHINGNKSDNRFANLRLATKSQNKRNQGKQRSNTSGFKGVTKAKGYERWTAQIRDGVRNRKLGWFDSPEKAYSAYCAAAARLHGEFAHV